MYDAVAARIPVLCLVRPGSLIQHPGSRMFRHGTDTSTHTDTHTDTRVDVQCDRRENAR